MLNKLNDVWCFDIFVWLPHSDEHPLGAGFRSDELLISDIWFKMLRGIRISMLATFKTSCSTVYIGLYQLHLFPLLSGYGVLEIS